MQHMFLSTGTSMRPGIKKGELECVEMYAMSHIGVRVPSDAEMYVYKKVEELVGMVNCRVLQYGSDTQHLRMLFVGGLSLAVNLH